MITYVLLAIIGLIFTGIITVVVYKSLFGATWNTQLASHLTSTMGKTVITMLIISITLFVFSGPLPRAMRDGHGVDIREVWVVMVILGGCFLRGIWPVLKSQLGLKPDSKDIAALIRWATIGIILVIGWSLVRQPLQAREEGVDLSQSFDRKTGQAKWWIDPETKEVFASEGVNPRTGTKLRLMVPGDTKGRDISGGLNSTKDFVVNLIPSPGPRAEAREQSNQKTVLVPVAPAWSEEVVVPWPLRFSTTNDHNVTIRTRSGKTFHDGPGKDVRMGANLSQEDTIFQFQSEESSSFELTVKWW